LGNLSSGVPLNSICRALLTDADHLDDAPVVATGPVNFATFSLALEAQLVVFNVHMPGLEPSEPLAHSAWRIHHFYRNLHSRTSRRFACREIVFGPSHPGRSPRGADLVLHNSKRGVGRWSCWHDRQFAVRRDVGALEPASASRRKLSSAESRKVTLVPTKAYSSHAYGDGLGGFGYRLDQCRWMPFRRQRISFSQGAEWKALIREYITTIASKEAPCCVAAQSKSGWPTLKATVSSAMIAKVGEAARASKWPAGALMLSGIIRMGFVMLLALRDFARRS
jgi:hypothetical protein